MPPENPPPGDPAPAAVLRRGWGGRRAGAGAPRGPRAATRARIAELRALLPDDAAASLFADLAPAELARLAAWRLLGLGRWEEAGRIAAGLAPFHHHRVGTRGRVRQGEGAALDPPGSGTPDPLSSGAGREARGSRPGSGFRPA